MKSTDHLRKHWPIYHKCECSHTFCRLCHDDKCPECGRAIERQGPVFCRQSLEAMGRDK
ncbi:hypothetical protein LCGC14_1499760 [marine sediment metagenome]|uniref:Uncharacterized protein n=1 Tax=marine sediment metagenome TaxID=412755 RepID=A0A0F9JQ98_9ZZZZ